MWTVCIDSIYVNNNRWAYSFHSDVGNGTGICTNLGTGSTGPATDPQPTKEQVAKAIACDVGDSVKLKATGVVYTCSLPPPPGTEDNRTAMALIAAGIILGGLYYWKKLRK